MRGWASQSPRQSPRRPEMAWWMITRNIDGRMEVLTVPWKMSEVLPVFSGEGEADLFVWLGGYGDGWHPMESRAGEILSVLHGPCAGAKSVALDPSPEMVTQDTLALVRLDRERFARCLIDSGRPRLAPTA